MSMSVIAAPSSIDEITTIVEQIAADNKTVEIIGNGSKRSIGHNVTSDIVLHMNKLNSILEYNHSELVMTAQAGTPLDIIRTELTKNNQMLAFEPPNYSGLFGDKTDQTLGGIIGGNLSGSRRLSAGAARDGLLGVGFVNGRGECIKSGGKVMKNVTGLDLVKYFAGSWGTLGVMSDMTVKVLPQPDVINTVVVFGLSDAAGAQVMAQAMAQSVEVSSAAHLPSGVAGKVLDGSYNKSMTLLRLEGLKASVKDREQRLLSVLSDHTDKTVLGQRDSDKVWQEITDVDPFSKAKDKVLWKVSVAPMMGCKLVENLRNAGCDLEAYYDWQGGLVWLQLNEGHCAEMLRSEIKKLGGGHATLIRADLETRRMIAVFEPLSLPVSALTTRIKQQFDPKGIFNPGRMALSDIVIAKAAG